MLDNGADPNGNTECGGSLLGLEPDTGNNSRKILRLLLAAGADPNKQDSDGDTALHIQVERQNPREIKLLIAGGANVNSANYDNETPLDKYYLGLDQFNDIDSDVASVLINNGGIANFPDLIPDGDPYFEPHSLVIFTRRTINLNRVNISVLPDVLRFD